MWMFVLLTFAVIGEFTVASPTLFRNRRSVLAPSILPTECGASSVQTTKIVGGREALLGAWPWMAAVYILDEPLCGGVLVTKEHVLTAAHCVVNKNDDKKLPADAFRIRVGEHNLDEDVEDGATPQDVEVKEVIPHKGFSFSHVANDIAILKLQQPVRFRKHVRPICLPYSGAYASASIVGQDAYVAGWGVWDVKTRASSSVLREVQLPVWKDEACQEVSKVPGEGVFCAGYPAGGKDSCKGDSGGPMMLKDTTDKFYLLGIVSHGNECAKANNPGVYTNVRHYLEWIAKHLK